MTSVASRARIIGGSPNSTARWRKLRWLCVPLESGRPGREWRVVSLHAPRSDVADYLRGTRLVQAAFGREDSDESNNPLAGPAIHAEFVDGRPHGVAQEESAVPRRGVLGFRGNGGEGRVKGGRRRPFGRIRG